MNKKKFHLKLITPAFIEKIIGNIFFVHIPKCGGTTIDHIAQRYQISKQEIDFFRFKKITDKQIIINYLNLNKKKIYASGHLNENSLDFMLDSDLKKITIIRDPIKREISHYKFHLHRKKINIQESNFEDFLISQYNSYKDNVIVRILANIYHTSERVSKDHVNLAIKNLKDNFWLYANFDHWDLFAKILISFLGIPNVLYTKMQSYSYDFEFKISQKELDLINKYSAYDIMLYDTVFSDKKFYLNDFIDLNKTKVTNQYLLVIPEKTEQNKNFIFSPDELKKLYNINIDAK